MTLYELLSINTEDNGSDICDNEFDFLTYMCVPKDNEINKEDYYNLFINLVAKKLNVLSYGKNYIECDISKFIYQNIKAFNKFMNKFNKEDYQPKSYKLNYASFNDIDELFYDLYMQTIECLLSGNYSNNDYKVLIDMLEKK